MTTVKHPMFNYRDSTPHKFQDVFNNFLLNFNQSALKSKIQAEIQIQMNMYPNANAINQICV